MNFVDFFAAAKNVCNFVKSHCINDLHLTLTLVYNTDFGEFWDTEKHKVAIPDKYTPPAVDKYHRDLVTKSTKISTVLDDMLKPKHAKVTITETLHIECKLTQSTPNVRTLASQWRNTIQDVWRAFVEDATAKSEMIIQQDIWNLLQSHVDKDKERVKEHVHIHIIEHQGGIKLVFVGERKIFESVTKSIEEEKSRLESELERKKAITTHTEHYDKLKIKLLNRLNKFSEVSSINDDLKVEGDSNSGKVKFTGVKDDINTAKTVLEQEMKGFTSIVFSTDGNTGHHLSMEEMRLLHNKKILKDLEKELEGMPVELALADDTMEVLFIDSSISDARLVKLIERCIHHTNVPLTTQEERNILHDFKWRSHCDQLMKDHEDEVIIKTHPGASYSVTSVAGLHSTVLEGLVKFLEENTTYSEKLPIHDEDQQKFLKEHGKRAFQGIMDDCDVIIETERNNVVIKGTQKRLQQCAPEVKAYLGKLVSEIHKIDRMGVGTLISSKHKDIISSIEKSTRTTISLPGTASAGHMTQNDDSDSDDNDVVRETGEEAKYDSGMLFQYSLK